MALTTAQHLCLPIATALLAAASLAPYAVAGELAARRAATAIVAQATAVPPASATVAPRDPRPQVFALLDKLPKNRPVYETVTLPVARDKDEQFRRHLDELIRATRKVEGLKTFEVHRRAGAPNENPEYFLYEVWKSPAGLRKQWESEHLRVFQARLGEEGLLAGAPDLRFYTPR